jgi:N-methylhydantoinase A/oxoprolinase/acetone carboxylase beta subunit
VLAQNAVSLAALERLSQAGFAQISGFTPTDAAHVIGIQSQWSRKAAQLGAELFARRRDGRGKFLFEASEHRTAGEQLSSAILELVTRRSAEAILETAFAEDGLDGPTLVNNPLVQRAIDGIDGVTTLAIAPDRPVIGLGASAALHYARLPERLGVEVNCPSDADVANALGAVVGPVRITARILVTAPEPDRFRVNGVKASMHESLEAALAEARRCAEAEAAQLAQAAGASVPSIELSERINTVTTDGLSVFFDAEVVAVLTARPRSAR